MNITYQYRPVAEEAYHPDIGYFETYGLEIHIDGYRIQTQHDVAVDREVVEEIARACTAAKVEPSRVMDVVENMLG